MNALLTRLGVPMKIQVFFRVPPDLWFNYDDTEECYSENFHRVPSTQNLWVAGDETASHVVVTHSAMEAMRF